MNVPTFLVGCGCWFLVLLQVPSRLLLVVVWYVCVFSMYIYISVYLFVVLTLAPLPPSGGSFSVNMTQILKFSDQHFLI